MTLSRSLIRFFLVFAWCGVATSLAIYLRTFSKIDVENQLPYLWVGHLFVFVTFAPAVAVGRDLAGSTRRPDYWKLALRYIPAFFRFATYGMFFYFIANLVTCLLLMDFGSPGYFHGQAALLEHGTLLRYLSAAEFQKMNNYEARLFSGADLVFFFISAALLTSAKNAPADFDHDVNVLIPPVGSVR